MDTSYFPWPAASEDLIKVFAYIGDSPVYSHRHDYIEIVFIAYGSCMHSYHNTEITLIPGDTFIVVPHEEHSYSINSRTVIYNCLFYPEALGEDWKQMKEIGGIYDFLMVEPFYRTESHHQEILHLQPSEALHIESILKNMIGEDKNRQTGYSLVQKGNLITLLALLGRVWEKQFSSNRHSYDGKREMLSEALKYIEQNVNDDFKIDDLAARVYLSPNFFRKIFRKVTGLTPIEYINKIRISKATRLLLEQSNSISGVSESVGINDINYFSRLFRTIIGCSPSEFRKRNNLY